MECAAIKLLVLLDILLLLNLHLLLLLVVHLPLIEIQRLALARHLRLLHAKGHGVVVRLHWHDALVSLRGHLLRLFGNIRRVGVMLSRGRTLRFSVTQDHVAIGDI